MAIPMHPHTQTPRITRLGLIAGEGKLPLHVAQNAVNAGIEVMPFVIEGHNARELARICRMKGETIVPGLVRQTLDRLSAAQVSHVVFAGKVNKWTLLRNPRLDDLAVEALKKAVRANDDMVMLWVVEQLEALGIQVLPQTAYLQDLFLEEKVLTRRQPTMLEWRDIRYGFEIAKEMGRLDIGQTIVAHQGMIVAVEAIEGTDECLKRSGKLVGKKGGVVVKVAKPEQDQRFDVPTVGLRTLKTMRRAGLQILATEASQTLYLEPEDMAQFADKHGMAIVSTSWTALQAL